MAWIVTTVLVAISIALTTKITKDLGIHKVIYNHAPGRCQFVNGMGDGSEDLVVMSNGLVLISSGIFLPVPSSSVKSTPGKLYVYDPTKQAAPAEPLSIEGNDWKNEQFYPGGLAIWEEKGETMVYVINTYNGQIHFFQLKLNEKKLIHKRTVGNDQIATPNNVVLIGRDRFYVTNFLYFKNTIAKLIEMALRLPIGSVWYFDGDKFTQVLSGMKGPNGVALSKSRKHLYVAALMEESLHVYQIQPSPTNLNLISVIDLGSGIDNINVDNAGSLWIGCHPKLFQVHMHLQDPTVYTAPSQVLKVTFLKDDHSAWNVEEPFADDGKKISGSSVAAYTGSGYLLVGTVNHKTMVCKI